MSYRSVLLVDDDDRAQKMLTFFLVKNGLNVVSAKDGFAAIKILNILRPDIILFDLVMPGMDGFELCRRIKEAALWGDIPLIAISALSAADNREKILSLGVSDYFEKPFDIYELLDRVIKLLDIKKDVFRCNSDRLNFKEERYESDRGKEQGKESWS